MAQFLAGTLVGAALALLLLARRIYRVGVVDGKEAILDRWVQVQQGRTDGEEWPPERRAQKGEIDGR